MHLLWSHGLGGEIMSSSDFLGCVARSARGVYALLEVFPATLPALLDVPGVAVLPTFVYAVIEYIPAVVCAEVVDVLAPLFIVHREHVFPALRASRRS